MVILDGIRLNSTGIECDYNPEKSGKTGHIALNVDGSSKIEFSDYEYGKKTYSQAVINKLQSLMDSKGEIPQQAAVIWY